MVRAHSLPVAERQAPPQPPRLPAASIVFLAPHSRASARMSRAGILDSPFSPLRRFGHAVGLAEDVILPLVEAHSAMAMYSCVVGALGQPRVGDAETESHVGAQPRREPLVGDKAGRVVVVRVDEDHLDAQLFEPEPADRALESGVDPTPRALGVGRPEDDHLRVLERVLQQVVLLGDAQAVAESPHVHATPVPPFPAIRVVSGLDHPHQVRRSADRRCDGSPTLPHRWWEPQVVRMAPGP